jgi:hypothetical protein
MTDRRFPNSSGHYKTAAVVGARPKQPQIAVDFNGYPGLDSLNDLSYILTNSANDDTSTCIGLHSENRA